MINWIQQLEFEHPWFLLLLGLLPLMLFWKYKKAKAYEFFFPIPSIGGLTSTKSIKSNIYLLLPYLRVLALLFLIVAMARPRLALKEEVVKAEGIDIMLILDLSSSMLSKDFNPNRLEASKKVAKEFVAAREYDRIGLSVFSGEAFTLCPLTSDHKVLNALLDDIQAGILTDGTAIGNGLSAAINRLKDTESKSKVAILLTDGVNNRGYIDPETASQIAVEFGIKVYTIGVGTNGLAQSPVGKNRRGDYYYDYVRVNIDEQLLRMIANQSGGKYFRATNETELKDIYDEIDQLEKTKIEQNVFKRYNDEFEWLVWIGLGILLLELLLGLTFLKTMPG